MLVQLDQTERALADYRRATVVDPAFGVAWWNLGSLLHRAGEREEAIGALRRALALASPENRAAIARELEAARKR